MASYFHDLSGTAEYGSRKKFLALAPHNLQNTALYSTKTSLIFDSLIKTFVTFFMETKDLKSLMFVINFSIFIGSQNQY